MRAKTSVFSPLYPFVTLHSWSWTHAAKDKMPALIVSFVWTAKSPFRRAHKRHWTFSQKMTDIRTLGQARIFTITYSILCEAQMHAVLIARVKDQAPAYVSHRMMTF